MMHVMALLFSSGEGRFITVEAVMIACVACLLEEAGLMSK